MQRLKVLAVATVFGLFAGLAGASMLVGWIWPTLGEGDAWIVSRSRSVANRQQLQDRVSAVTQDTLFTLYSRSGAVTDKNVLLLGAPLGNGVGILSQGWIASQLPATSRASDLLAVSAGGLSYAVTDVAVDKSSGTVYLHLSRLVNGKPSTLEEQIHTSALVDTLAAPADVVVYSDGTWLTSSIIDDLVPLSGEAHSLSANVFGYRLADTALPGSIVFDDSGRLLGFVNKNGLVTALPPAQTLSELIAGQPLTHPGLGIQGWFSDERPLIIGGQKANGFLVAKADPKATAFKKGDILYTVNGEPFTVSSWRRQTAGAVVRLEILRSGQTTAFVTTILSE